MTNVATESAETVRSGGFIIETSSTSLRVTADKTADTPRKKSTARILVRIVCYGGAAFVIAMSLADFLDRHSPTLVLAIVAILCLPYLLSAFRGSNDIFCSRNTFGVVRKIRGKVTGQWTFPRDLVGPIRFAIFSSSRTTSICGLLFSVEGKKIKVLAGLEIVEADKILGALDRLGYPVVRDVGMPMAVEMALERRDSIFN